VKKVTVYGPGCAKCRQAEELVRRVATEMGAQVQVEKASAVQAMVKAGILATPAVAVDGVVKVSGRVPKENEVKAWIAE
jgi:small redox-active disulfide protein 2